MKKRELIVLISVFLAALVVGLLLFILHGKGNCVVIYSDGKELTTMPLDKDTQMSVKGKNTVCIENNEVFVNWADCPDKLCIKQGKLSKSGKSIVCLPNRLTVKIEER